MNQMLAARERAEGALAKSRRLLGAVVEGTSVPIEVRDRQGRYLVVNSAAARTRGLTATAMVGRLLPDLVAPAVARDVAAADAMVIHHGGSDLREERRQWGARVRTYLVSRSPLLGPANEVAGVVSVAHDVSELEHALEEQLRLRDALGRSETMAAMGALVATVAHEVRNPLFAMTSTLDAFEDRMGNLDGAAHYTAALRAQCERMNRMMSDLLSYGRPQMAATRPGAVPDVIDQAVRVCESQARERGVRVERHLTPDLPDVPMDADRLLLAFRNLLENAIQHAPQGGRVRIEASLADGGERVLCEVTDDGPGFPPADLPRLFVPFHSRRPGGTGLGLAIVRSVTDDHGGEVSADNHPAGGGRVRIWLPLATRIPLRAFERLHAASSPS
jgi:PAS domain S-box-containing protein